MKRNRGFTLIEIMMAMAIFALVLAAIYSTWVLIMRASRTGREVAAQVQRERVAVHTVKEALSSVRSFAADLKDYTFVVENGSEPMLSFSARLPESFPRGGRHGDFAVRRVMFSLENGQDGERDLVMRQWPILMEMDEDEREHPLVLARNVKDFMVETWDTKAGKEGDWSDTWKQTNQIPTKVKVTLVLNSPGRRGGYSESQEAIFRVIDLPSVTVQATWQTPLLQRGAAGNPANPVNPVNPGNPGIPGGPGRPGFPAGPGDPRVKLQ
jgi:type II secretion system protein J